jgi:CheY-like chemotaxis protein
VPEEPETGLLDELPISNARRTGTVLVVEDEPAVLRLVAETLRSAGFVVHTASGPEEALQLAGQAGLRVDLVLSDVVIPRRSGLEIVDEVRQWHPGVRALFMSGYADAALEALLRSLPHCLAAGGRAAILTFHSGEDRRVKKAFQAGRRSGVYAAVAETVVRSSQEETRANRRAASAKLRWAVRGHAPACAAAACEGVAREG